MRFLGALSLSLLLSFSSYAQTANKLDYFPIDQVRLLDSPFKHAQQKNVEYILQMDVDRLLAPFLAEAGLPTKAERYGNWENTGLDGHIGGHYLSALSLAYAATGDARLSARLDDMLDQMQAAQLAHGNGYLGGVPNGDALWTELRVGKIDAGLFALNGYWVPWYNLHKTYAGLRDAYEYAGREQAKAMLLALGEWTWTTFGELTPAQFETMLTTEYGGMNEVMIDLAEISGDDRYVELARRFSHKKILEPLINERDELDGLHANTQIPKVVGYQRIAAHEDFGTWHEAARFFWNDVVYERSVAIGGNSVREHFHSRDDFSSMVQDVEGPETCNTYNMLKLTKLLYQVEPETDYVEYYERALYNHILSSQHPDTGGLVYFTPMRPQHYRKYSTPDEAMWCCVGSGIENHSKYGEFIYAKSDRALWVNLFIPSELNWVEQGVRIVQTNALPDQEVSTITVQGDAQFAMHIRYPQWVKKGKLRVRINGRKQKVRVTPGQYIVLDRQWQAGDVVELSLPMTMEFEGLPDGSDYVAVRYGPVVLAAAASPFENEQLAFFADDSRMGHIASGPLCPLDQAPMFLGSIKDIKLKRLPGESLAFSADRVVYPESASSTVLVPFFRVHDTRYTVYWPHATKDELQSRLAEQAALEQERLALEQQTIDKIAPGEQQPESDHFFKSKNSEAGVNKGLHWRHARDGWFSYELNDPSGEAGVLELTYFGLDAGRSFTIEVNEQVLAEVTLDGSQGDRFFTVRYPLSEAVKKAGSIEGKLLLKFVAKPGSIAGGIYGIRLLREDVSQGE